MTSASISAIIIFASGIWQGKDVKEAAKDGIETAGRVIGKSAIIYTITMQVNRTNIWNYALNDTMANPINTVSEKVAGNIAESSLAKSSICKKYIWIV